MDRRTTDWQPSHYNMGNPGSRADRPRGDTRRTGRQFKGESVGWTCHQELNVLFVTHDFMRWNVSTTAEASFCQFSQQSLNIQEFARLAFPSATRKLVSENASESSHSWSLNFLMCVWNGISGRRVLPQPESCVRTFRQSNTSPQIWNTLNSQRSFETFSSRN
jgi:hypothetical protein